MQRVCGRAQASTDGGRRAPFELGEDVEREARGLRIEGLAAAAASTLTRGSLSADRLPPPPSSARTARSYLPITHGVEHGEPARRVRSSDSRARWAASSAVAPPCLGRGV
eukprot:5146046-Prymnesium_polylepis.1